MRLSADMPEVPLHTFVSLNGEDISGVCREADDVEGWAECIVADQGRAMKAPDSDGPVTEVRHGMIEFRFASEAAREHITRLYGGAE